MMNNKIIVLALAISILALPMGSSLVDSTIKVLAEPVHNVVLKIYNGNGGNLITVMVERADEDGNVEFQQKFSLETIDIEVTEVHPLTNEKTTTQFDDIKVESVIELVTADEVYQPDETTEENEEPTESTTQKEMELEVTVEEPEEQIEVTTTEESPQISSGLTGFIVQDGKPTGGAYFIGLAALLLIGALGFTAYKMRQSVLATTNNTDDFQKELKDAEKKLKEAQREIEDIKNRKSPEIKKAEEEFLKAKENYEKATGKKVSLENTSKQTSQDDLKYQKFQDKN